MSLARWRCVPARFAPVRAVIAGEGEVCGILFDDFATVATARAACDTLGVPMTDKAPLKLLCVTAHPDDECFAFGGALALAARDGIETFVLCLTDGQAANSVAIETDGDQFFCAFWRRSRSSPPWTMPKRSGEDGNDVGD